MSGFIRPQRKHEESIKNPELIKFRNRILLESISKQTDNTSISIFKNTVSNIKYLTIYYVNKYESIDLIHDMILLNKILSTINKYIPNISENYRNKAINTYDRLEELKLIISRLQGKQNIEKYRDTIIHIRYKIYDILDYISN
jgi:hypothetical protein